MYLGIDVGGTKTLVASLDDSGVILAQQKFPTPQDYQEFLAELSPSIQPVSIAVQTVLNVLFANIQSELSG